MIEIAINEIPSYILNAAHEIEAYFIDRDVACWALSGIQSRARAGASPLADNPRVIDASVGNLIAAVMHKDHPPQDAESGVQAAAMHLGLCCLGGRVLRLKLPNGKTIRVTLE